MDYRQVFVNALENAPHPEAREVVAYARAVPGACWGALYQRFLETVKSPEALKSAVECFCNSLDCDRFLLLLLHQRQDEAEAVRVFIDAAAKLPVMSQTYLLCLVDGAARDNLAPEALQLENRQLVDDPQARARERQVLDAKIAKLLRLEFAGAPAPRSQRPNTPTPNAIDPSPKPQEAP